MSSSSGQIRSSLLNFFIYNTDYGQREGTEEEKIMLYIPTEESMDKKNNAVGLCQALAQFVQNFNPSRECECLVTHKTKQYFLNPEGNFWMVMTLKIPFAEKVVKEKKVIEYFTDDIQDGLGQAILKQAYEMFVLFNGFFSFIIEKHGIVALKERFQFFYTRYLATLNFGQMDLLDVYQGVVYLPLEKVDFLKMQCFINLVENTFSAIQHICVLHNDQLVWTSLNQKDVRILYKYLTTSLFPASSDGDDGLIRSSPVSSIRVTPVSYTVPNPGRFLTAPVEMVIAGNNVPKRSPRVFVTANHEISELNLLVYKAHNTVMCFMLDSQSLTTDYCTKLHNFVGPQLGNMSIMITEQLNKRASLVPDQQYRYIYFNSMNLAIRSSIHSKRSSQVVSVSPDIMKLLVDIQSEITSQTSDVCEIVTKTMADCWIVGKKSGCREFFVILNQKNATIVEICEEVQRLMNTSFSNILFLE